MRDIYPATMLVGYQFILRWTNAHAMWLKRMSPLSTRILETLMTMPLNHPRLKEDIIEKVRPALPPTTVHLFICSSSAVFLAVAQGVLAWSRSGSSLSHPRCGTFGSALADHIVNPKP